MAAQLAVVTGAFSYTGAHVAQELLARGWRVRTLTGRPAPRADWARAVEAMPLEFDDDALSAALAGAEVFVNTFWIRYPRRGRDFEWAVARSAQLFDCANRAGVGRIVHLSVSNPDRASSLAYYAGKAHVEDALRAGPVPATIVRPTLIYGRGEVLLNNIAWCLRRAPLFTIPGGGHYRVQPVSAAAVARLVADAATEGPARTLDAAGEEIVTFRELVQTLRRVTGARTLLVDAPPWVSLALANLVSIPLGDRMIVAEELQGLAQETLVSDEPPRGGLGFGAWLQHHGPSLGRVYVNETRRHFAARHEEPLAAWSEDRG